MIFFFFKFIYYDELVLLTSATELEKQLHFIFILADCTWIN